MVILGRGSHALAAYRIRLGLMQDREGCDDIGIELNSVNTPGSSTAVFLVDSHSLPETIPSFFLFS